SCSANRAGGTMKRGPSPVVRRRIRAKRTPEYGRVTTLGVEHFVARTPMCGAPWRQTPRSLSRASVLATLSAIPSDRKPLRRHPHAAQLRPAFFQTEATPNSIAHRIRLLKDFFEYVVGIRAFFNVFGRKFDFTDLMTAAFAGQRADLEFASLHRDDIKVI